MNKKFFAVVTLGAALSLPGSGHAAGFTDAVRNKIQGPIKRINALVEVQQLPLSLQSKGVKLTLGKSPRIENRENQFKIASNGGSIEINHRTGEIKSESAVVNGESNKSELRQRSNGTRVEKYTTNDTAAFSKGYEQISYHELNRHGKRIKRVTPSVWDAAGK